VDLHKYAYCPKGASLVFHRSPRLRSYHIFSFTKWLGYTLVNSTLQSTKSGGPLAAAWAVINYVGDEGYLEFARRKLEAVKKIKQAISGIPELYLMVEPEMTLVSFSSEEVNIFHIIDEMNLKGWYIQPSLSFDGVPANIHLTVTLSNVVHSDQFIDDLKACVKKAKQLPSGELLKKLKPTMDKQGAALLDNPAILFERAGIKEGQMPQRMAPVNEVLDALPPEWREKLLLHVANGFFHPDS
jgi:glutamate/tyrosine decarboxylase-like PLP-dependent enzyme